LKSLNIDNIMNSQINGRTANKRFGATAAGSADLKGSAEMPPLRQAATPLCASSESAVDRVTETVKT
jgi:hypothetical protein